MLEDCLDFIPAYWGCLRAGHVAVALSSLATEARGGRGSRALAGALASLAPRLILVDEELHAIAAREVTSCQPVLVAESEGDEAALESANLVELAYMLATSGSSGSAKLVAISGNAVLYRAFTTRHAAAKDFGAAINTFPIDSTTGIFSANLGCRENIHLPMAALARDPTSLFATVEMHRASSFSITDTMASRIVEAAADGDGSWDLSSLRQVAFGAETVLPSTVRRLDEVLRRFGAPAGTIGAGYGTTETGTLLTGVDLSEFDLAAGPGVPLGTPAPNVAIRIVDAAGTIVLEGTVGEVEVHAPLKMFSSYWGDQEATARSFTADGWWRTGDTGLLWEGQLTLKGRTKDVFISNGRKHALGAIDEAMREALGPQEAAFACTIPGRDGQAEVLGVALVAPPLRHAPATAAARLAVGQAFGLPVAVIRPVPSSAIPLTPTGKVKRPELAALLSEPEASLGDTPTVVEGERPAPSEAGVASIWEAVLGPGTARDPHADYFVLGGSSLRSIELFSRVELRTGVAIEPKHFFARPTLAALSDLVETAVNTPRQSEPSFPEAWPLSKEQYKKQLILIEPWQAERPTASRLILGFNTTGSKPPIFLVCQDEYEVQAFARSFGPDQPVFGLRSGHHIIEHRDDEVQAFALRYVADIEALRPKGPILLAGICQGGVIALAMAQHLLRRDRHVPLLALMEWPTTLHPYPGRVLFVFGERSHLGNPYRQFREPERGWRRHHIETEVVAMPGGHWDYLLPENLPKTAAILADKFDRALRLPMYHLPSEYRRAKISLGPLPSRIKAGRSFTLNVSVTNASAIPWSETARSGLMLAYRWLDDAGKAVNRQGARAALPALPPNSSRPVPLTVVTPSSAGRLNLIIDVVEEGSVWFGSRHPEGTASVHFDVAAESGDDDRKRKG